MRYNILLMLIISLLTQCKEVNKGSEKISEKFEQTTEYKNSRRISIIKLISNPQEYHQKRIEIKGYLHVEFEDCAIYLNETDYLNGIDKNSIWINIPRDSLRKLMPINKSYILLDGTFDMNNNGNESNYSGAIDSIIAIKQLH